MHANVAALDAVVAELERERFDAILVGGDGVAGPFPRETFARLRALDAPAFWIRGNCDRELADGEEAHDPLTKFSKAELSAEEREWLSSLPDRLALDVDGLGRVLFVHGSPRGDDEFLTQVTPDERLREVLHGVEERFVVCGHSHHQFVRDVDGVRVVGAGAVGHPNEARPGAYWLLLGPEAEHRRTAYEVDAEAIRRSGYPRAEELVGKLLDPEHPDVAAPRLEAAKRAG